MHRRLALLLCLGSVLAALAAPKTAHAYTVRNDHPRILFTEADLPLLRQRCQTTHASIYQRLRDWVEDQQRMGMKNASFCDDYAFLALMSQDPAHLQWAIEVALYNANRGIQVGGEGGAVGRLSCVALAYDWLYDEMTTAQRDTLERAFAPFVRTGQSNYLTGAAWLPTDSYYGYAVAIHGEGVADAEAASGLDISYRRFTERYVPALGEVGTNGSVDGYAGKRAEMMFIMSEVFRTGLGEDWASQSPFIRNSGSYWMHRLRGDEQLIRIPGKWNMADTDLARFFSYFAGRYGDPCWQWLANRYVADPSSWSVQVAWHLILWYDPTVTASWPPASLSYHCTGSGMTFMRDTWDLGPSSRAIHAGFFCGPDLVRTLSQGHLVIARGSDNLLIDSGTYQHDLDDHYYPYYTKAIAHNTILVVQPGEVFGTFTDYYNQTFTLPNDGGQKESDEDLGCVKYPNAECTYGYRGEIDRFTDTGEYLYARSDATTAYSASKATKVMREFVYVRPDIFVIRDLVRRTNASYKTKAIFHMIDRPTVDGNLSVVQGNLATGGVFESAAARKMVVSRGQSQARVRFMKPDAAAGVLRLVGGGNSNGQAWKQNWNPTDTNTYNASTSYEFWADGRNWISCGQYCSQAEIDGRNTDTPSNEAGDWRVEIEAPSTGVDVSLITFIKVGPANDPELPARLIDTPTAEGVAITRAPGDTVVVVFQRGEGLQEVRY